MFVRKSVRGWLGSSLVIGGLLACVPNAAADFPFRGDSWCSHCHWYEYGSYRQHGHPWMEIPTKQAQPGPDLFGFASQGVGLPDPATAPTMLPNGWADVAAILGNFKEGAGSFVRASDGKRVSVGGTTASTYTTRCFKCHNPTGYTPTGIMYGIAAWDHGAPASDEDGHAIQGVQCEQCHGPSWTMLKPDGNVCRDCHSRTDDAGDANHRIPFAPTADGKSGVFTNHHPQGDEYRRSPHKNVTDSMGRHLGCILCHDPHKSVWKGKGGVKFADTAGGAGNMCVQCHNRSVRGVMGELGLECVDCHMPEKSGGRASGGFAVEPTGHRRTHLFKINPTALKATDNVDGGYWKSTDLDGDSFLTLDMVCADCHPNLSISRMAGYAKKIHRQPGLADLTVNAGDGPETLKRNDRIRVDFSIEAGDKSGMSAQWWVLCQGPKGWSSWNGKKWVRGLRPWRKSAALGDVPEQNVLQAWAKPGRYTYWIAIYPTDGSEHLDSVPVYVRR